MTKEELMKEHAYEEAKFVSIYKHTAIYELQEYGIRFSFFFEYDDELCLLERVGLLCEFEGFEVLT